MLTTLLAVAVAVLAVLLAVALVRLRRAGERRRALELRGPWPIRTVGIDAVEPLFTPGPFGPGLETEVAYLGHGSLPVPGGTNDFEGWVLAALATRARLMFEFGTCTGKTAYLWARNSPPDARVVTITLRPEDAATYTAEPGDDARDTGAALGESAFARFLYSGTPVEGKVEQLYGDSKQLDVSPWSGRCDLVFVDGSHAYSYVRSDARKAIELARPGGLVLWHDYAGPRHSPGVWRALNELARELPLVHLERTSFVAYRKPA